MNSNTVYKYEYKASFKSLCPAFEHDVVDSYEVSFKTNRFIMVEKINEVLATYKDKKVFQESLCDELAKLDWFCGEVIMVGDHQNVKIISTSKSPLFRRLLCW